MLEASSKSMTSDTTPVSIGDPVDTNILAKMYDTFDNAILLFLLKKYLQFGRAETKMEGRNTEMIKVATFILKSY